MILPIKTFLLNTVSLNELLFLMTKRKREKGRQYISFFFYSLQGHKGSIIEKLRRNQSSKAKNITFWFR